jgi:hypothetical protein
MLNDDDDDNNISRTTRQNTRNFKGHAVAQGVYGWPVTTEILVQSQACPYGIYGVQSGIGTYFFSKYFSFPISDCPPMLPQSFICSSLMLYGLQNLTESVNHTENT